MSAEQNFGKEESKFFVIGDHPILKRPDRVITGEEKAKEYSAELKSVGYDNISMKPLVTPTRY